jgi:hypothetical protein
MVISVKHFTSISRSRQSEEPSPTPNHHALPRRSAGYPTKAEAIYRDGVAKIRAARPDGTAGLRPLELRSILAQIPSPQHGDHWGDWVFSEKNFTLTYDTDHGWFEVDLERMTNPARMLDAIFQFSTKVWAPREAVGDLVEALKDLLNPQSTLCSWGKAKNLDATKHLEELTASTVRRRLSTESSVAGFRLVTDDDRRKRSRA